MEEDRAIAEALVSLNLPPQACEWLMAVWRCIQTFDDYADGDTVSRDRLDQVIMETLVTMPGNSFYQQHQSWLLPAMLQMVLKWQASDLAERRGLADARSYVWRAGYYDVVCLVAALVHGPASELALAALSMYGEKFDAYLAEFDERNSDA